MKKWPYNSARDLDQDPADRLRQFPREPDMLVYGLRSFCALIIRALLRVYNRFEIVGQQNLRTNRSLVIVANHCSHLDTLCLLAALPLKKLHCAFPAAASDYFFQRIPRLWAAAVLVNALPFARNRVRQSLSLCQGLLAKPGTILIIFPEGTRSTTGKVGEFKSGVGALVAGQDVAVVPCFIDGSHRAWPKGRRLPRPRKIRLIVGPPRNYRERTTDKIEVASIATELRDAVVALGEGGTRSQPARRGESAFLRSEADSLMTENTFTSWDGTELFYRSWIPSKASNKALLLFHRGHEHSGRWQAAVDSLGLNDVSIFAWDARGHGRSPGERGTANNIHDVTKDVDAFARHVSKTHGIPIENMIVLAHSLAAVAVTAWIHDYAPPIRAMILATAAFKVKLYVPFAILALRILRPRFVKSYVRSKMLTRDREEAALYDSDPLIFRQIAVNLLLDLHDVARRLVSDAGAIHTPSLMIGAGKDWVVSLKTQREFFDRLSSSDKRFEIFPGTYHAIFHETNRREVIDLVRDFVTDRFASPPMASSLMDADKRGYTAREYRQLQRNGSAKFAIARVGLKIARRLSRGIEIGFDCGFDSGLSLDYVYESNPRGVAGIGRLIDKSYLNSIGWRGIRQRRLNLESTLRELIRIVHHEGRPVRILDIAAGPGRYVIETIRAVPEMQINATLCDYKPENIAAARALADASSLNGAIVAQRGDAFDRESLGKFHPRATIGIVSGLYELFSSNDAVLNSLRGLANAIEPNGYLIYTNQPWHPQLEFIAHVLRNHQGKPWIMRRRTTAEIDELVRAAGFVKLDMEIDEWGMFTVSIAKRLSTDLTTQTTACKRPLDPA